MVQVACGVGMSVGVGGAGNRENDVVSVERDVSVGSGVAR